MEMNSHTVLLLVDTIARKQTFQLCLTSASAVKYSKIKKREFSRLIYEIDAIFQSFSILQDLKKRGWKGLMLMKEERNRHAAQEARIWKKQIR